MGHVMRPMEDAKQSRVMHQPMRPIEVSVMHHDGNPNHERLVFKNLCQCFIHIRKLRSLKKREYTNKLGLNLTLVIWLANHHNIC